MTLAVKTTYNKIKNPRKIWYPSIKVTWYMRCFDWNTHLGSLHFPKRAGIAKKLFQDEEVTIGCLTESNWWSLTLCETKYLNLNNLPISCIFPF